MISVIIESPFAERRGIKDGQEVVEWTVEQNIAYARRCVRHALRNGEAPIAFHLLYTQIGVLYDEVPEERALGIDAGLTWLTRSERHIFYTDHGWSSGMLAALNYHVHGLGSSIALRKICIRALDGEPTIPDIINNEWAQRLRACIQYIPEKHS